MSVCWLPPMTPVLTTTVDQSILARRHRTSPPLGLPPFTRRLITAQAGRRRTLAHVIGFPSRHRRMARYVRRARLTPPPPTRSHNVHEDMYKGGSAYVSVSWLPPVTLCPYDDGRSINTRTSSQNLAAAAQGGYIYTSTDYGANWTETNAGSRDWMAIASSSDGAVRVTGAADPPHTLAVMLCMKTCTRAGQHMCLSAGCRR